VLRGVRLELHAGETVGLIGESGAGKTSLLRSMTGLCASTGELTLLGADPRSEKPKQTQMLWQDPGTSLDPTLPLHKLLEISARLGRSAGTTERTVAEALQRVDLQHRSDALAGELSGGEQRRASLAQIWLAGARVVLADEPTAGLDDARAAEALALLRAVVGPEGGIVVASHDLGQVLPLCHRVYVLHEGACVDVFAPSEAADPARHPFTRDLLDAG
jgi:peptide/nickel transport system ATP-binding protein